MRQFLLVSVSLRIGLAALGSSWAILLGFGARPEVLAEAQRLRPLIERHAEIVASDFSGAEDVSEVDADLDLRVAGVLERHGDRTDPRVLAHDQ